jgi:hypothetical protein
VHIFAADGGANSIAGIAVDVEGGANIVAMFGQWGASQLLLAMRSCQDAALSRRLGLELRQLQQRRSEVLRTARAWSKQSGVKDELAL